ncbi:MAG: Hsp20 family protein [Clostridiales bacterium]|nr:Hsp20 family protein [Clostridiales bacterium]
MKSIYRSNELSNFEDFCNTLDDFFTPRSLERGTFKLDLLDGEKEYTVEAELPGIKKEEVNLTIEEGRLAISVERKAPAEEEKKTYLHRERRTTSMSRSIYLQDAAPNGVKAKMDNGILTITIAKKNRNELFRKIDIE